MRAEALDLTLRSLDHRLEVGNESLVDRVVCRAERVERGRARSVQNPEHGELLWGSGFDEHLVPRNAAVLTGAFRR
jgi:hypothetical protein